MCGIAGWVGRVAAGKETAEKMRDAMLHRGPDEQRISHFDGVTLIHNRLKILDLTPTGAQPMSNEDGTVWIIFNGEIYNYRELRAGLEKKGHIFKSQTDTESILHLYEEKGAECINDLRGMFAFAIYDSKKKTCFLARDRFGIKPLFYAVQNGFVAFSSEINALRKIPELPLEIDEQAVSDYISLFYIPAPLTFYKAIRALNPGQSLLIHQDLTLRFSTQPRFQFIPDKEILFQQAVEYSEHLLDEAVKHQLRSDVPLGSLLSGGIDSSLVSYFAQKHIETGLKTFNVGFPEKQYDESWAALAVARHIHSEHRTLSMGLKQGSWDQVCSLFLHAGQPYADTSILAMNEVSRLIRKHVTVALSGDGGDEGFGGYDFYWQIQQRLFLMQLIHKTPQPVQSLITFFCPSHGFSGKLKRAIAYTRNADDVMLLQHHFTLIRETELQNLWRGQANLFPIRRYFEPAWDATAIKDLSKLERFSAALSQVSADLVMANDFLVKVDIASMRHGLEVRVPMLDEELFGFAARLPQHLKVKGRKSKSILRALAQRRLPARVANKTKKGFEIPVDSWVDSDFKRKTKEFLMRSQANIRNFLNPSIYNSWIEAFCENKPFFEFSREGLYRRVMMLLALELHLERIGKCG